METYATHCPVNACVSQGWWVSSVTTAPLDAHFPSAQVTRSETTVLINKVKCGLNYNNT